MIQYILILKRSGGNIYEKNFGQIEMDETIMSGFFSAFFSFTQNLCGADVQDIELGPFRILFEVVGVELILAIIFDKSDSVLTVEQKLVELKNIVQARFAEQIKNAYVRTEDFAGLNEIVENIVLNTQTIRLSPKIKAKYLALMDKLSSTKIVLECALITIEGIPLIKKGTKEYFDLIIRQLDVFWKFRGSVLDAIVLNYENRYNILYRLNDDLILCAFVKRGTPIGLATDLVEEVGKKIAKLYPK